MVLQRAPARAIVWGFTAPGATVTTTMSSASSADGRGESSAMQTFKTVAGTDGTWRQTLPAMPASYVRNVHGKRVSGCTIIVSRE